MVAMREAVVGAGLLALLAGCSSGSAAAPAQATTSVTPGTTTTSTTASTTTPRPTTRTAVPPFIASTTWVRATGGRSLHIVPTASGRVAQGATDADEAWSEVLRLAPDADQPGMRAQFDCHWTFARLVQPDKPSWNIEPWRPVVTEQQLVDARCNPGGPESAEN
ncbi:MAG TPA: DUF2599 domain-containing protein [Lapillicoccus sp.]|nr:DUF2599 domain-containing protein [Lapillicoccus sp.]